ncbi:hypothetical protein [Luteolibacter sp.]
MACRLDSSLPPRFPSCIPVWLGFALHGAAAKPSGEQARDHGYPGMPSD